MKTRLCILGIPGSGKTTIAERLVERLGTPLYDVGAILRQQSFKDAHIASIHKEGGLVNSDRVLGIFEEALSQDSFLLCGSPRKKNEAKFILEHQKWKQNPGWLIYLELDKRLAKERLFSRGRFDDLDEKTLEKRFSDFESHTLDSIGLFKEQGRILTLDGSMTPDLIADKVLHFLEEEGC